MTGDPRWSGREWSGAIDSRRGNQHVTGHNERHDDVTGELTGPAGDVVDWYRRAMDLLDSRNDAAAAVLLERALRAEPGSPALREAMGRARFGSRRYAESADLFGGLVERDPTDHYARYGLGLALSRLGRQEQALEHLAVAVAMRPGRDEYDDALRQARATVDARRAAGP